MAKGARFESLGCNILIEQSEAKIKRIFFSKEMPAEPSDLAERIIGYVEGRCPSPPIELDLSSCTNFQRKVFEVLQEIPRGETTTYGGVAAKSGYPKGARAVGRALSLNPFAIVVPCHRVVAKKGLGGYFWGQEIKRGLLQLEQGVSPPD
jgi:methylated-DNA-[protein]-cysteine S-methyltransferase